MNNDEIEASPLVLKLVRAAVLIAVVGLSLILVFLWFGFKSWSVGLGVFLGVPTLLVAIGLYLTAVVIDLKQRDVI